MRAGTMDRSNIDTGDPMDQKRLLVLQNPGFISRFYLDGLIAGARQLGIALDVLEMGPLWQLSPSQMLDALPDLAERFRRGNIGAVLGYAWNGVMGFPTITNHDGRVISFIEALGIPNLLLWTDHPQFFNNCEALAGDVQPLLRAGNNRHFLKSSPAGLMCGWSECVRRKWCLIGSSPLLMHRDALPLIFPSLTIRRVYPTNRFKSQQAGWPWRI